MSSNRANSFFERFFWGKNLLREERDETPIVREREANEDELLLGYAEGEDEETGRPLVQLKGISQAHRGSHCSIVGSTGVGKTKFIESLILQDLEWGRPFCLIDPHVDLYNAIKAHFVAREDPDDLSRDIILIDPTDPENTATFNPLEVTEDTAPDELANELIFVFKKLWANAWGPRMEDIMRWSMVALAERGLTLYELPPLLTDLAFRDRVVSQVKDEQCRFFFEQRLGAQARRTQNEWMEAPLNKISALLSDRRVRPLFLSRKSSFNMRRDFFDRGKTILVKLDRGRLKGSADLLGALLVAKIQLAALSRSDIPVEDRAPRHLYIDEVQNFATDSFAQILSETRKYGLFLTIAHQYRGQLDKSLREAVSANCGIQTCFRLNRADASELAKETMTSLFAAQPGWEPYTQELQTLAPRYCYVKNAIEGGVVKLYTLDVAEPHQDADLTKQELAEWVVASPIGSAYLRKKSDIEAEYQARKTASSDFSDQASDTEDETYSEPEKPRASLARQTFLPSNFQYRDAVEKVESHLKNGDEANLRLAIIEADKLLDNTLKAAGCDGETTAKRLHNLEKGGISSANKQLLCEARRMRNGVVHDSDFMLNPERVRSSIRAYRLALNELGIEWPENGK
ncbi:MAG: ATP-binding protein [Candidatus Sungbacteria bacterium]|nr:ATP-binding protein [Candidatus Sungbacteria bacterium]